MMRWPSARPRRRQWLLTLASRASLVVAQHAGHAIPSDDPALVTAQVRAMLAMIQGR